MRKKYTDEQLKNAVKKCFTLQEVLNELGLIGGHARIKDKISKLDLDINHWKYFNNEVPRKILPINDILKIDTNIPTSNLRIRLLNNGMLDYICNICGISEWNNQYISLQLHHINGDRKDNRLKNLKLLSVVISEKDGVGFYKT